MADVPNTVNLRVICRLKPDEDEDEDEEEEEEKEKNKNNNKNNVKTTYNTETNTISIYPSRGGRKPLEFEFDGILGPSTSQENTFDVVAKGVIDGVLHGYNSTIFCYGQTTSGKTHTIFGKEGCEDPFQMGLLPRCVAYCIHCIKESRDVIEASITISAIEVFKEQLKDLISPQRSSKLKICLSPSGETYVENLTQKFMTSPDDALKMVEVIKLNRTKIAKHSLFSSHRSHCLACLTVKQKLSNNAHRKTKCYFVDSAGSELSEETANNNIKLVIHSLSAKKTQVPYKNSALTTILRDSLGGNTKTTCIITCSMQLIKRDETINSLRFGQRARLIENNIKLNRELSKYEMQRIIDKQSQLIQSLQAQTSDTLPTATPMPLPLPSPSPSQTVESETEIKYNTLLQQQSLDKVEKLTANEKYEDLESNYNDILSKYNRLQKEFNQVKEVNTNQSNEMQLLSQEIANHMATNDLSQKKMADLAQKNIQLQAISNTILSQLETLEKELEIQQNEIKRFENNNGSRDSIHNDYKKKNMSPPPTTPPQDMARGSVIIHKFISLPLSTTTPSTSPNNNNYNNENDVDMKADENENYSFPVIVDSHLSMVRTSHIQIKKSLTNLRELLEANFVDSHNNNVQVHDSKKVTRELISQYNNVMEQYHKLQKDYNETQKLLSERQNEIMILKQDKQELQHKNENLRYETERIKAEYLQRKNDLEKSIDQTKINQLRHYLDNKFTNNNNNNNTGNKILTSNDEQRGLREGSLSVSKSKSKSKSVSNSMDDIVHTLDGTSSSLVGSHNYLNLYSKKSGTKLVRGTGTETKNSKQEEWRQGLKQRFELIDTDNDGCISLDDFVKFTKQKNPNSSTQQIKKIFHQMDTQNTGKVTWIEFEKCFRKFAMKNMALKRLEAAGNRIDGVGILFDEREEFSKLGRKGKLHAIRVWYDNIIYGFKCTWIRKSSNPPNKIKQIIGSPHLSPHIKQEDVTEDVFMLRPDEYISCVTVWIGNSKVYGITFETTQNRWHEFGGGMGTPILLQPPDKHAIHAFYGGINMEHSLSHIGAYALPRKDYHHINKSHHHNRRRSSTSKSFSRSKSKSKSKSKSQSQSHSTSKRTKHYIKSHPAPPGSPQTKKQLKAQNNIQYNESNSNSNIVTRGQSYSVPAPNTSFIDVHDNKQQQQQQSPQEQEQQSTQEKQLKVQIEPPSPNTAENTKKKKKSAKFLWWNKK